MANLQRAGLIDYEKHWGSTFTSAGEDSARRRLRKHCRIERFLIGYLGVEMGFPDEACRLEHAMSDEIACRFDRSVALEPECPDCNNVDSRHCTRLGRGTVVTLNSYSPSCTHANEALKDGLG